MEIKKHLNNDEFLTFTASNRWLEKWKISYGISEKRVNGEAGEVSREIVNAWMERLWELKKIMTLLIFGAWTRGAAFSKHFQRKV